MNYNNLMTRSCGDVIKLLLVENNISQKQLADEMGVSCSTVSMWIKNTRVPCHKKVMSLCSYFGVDVNFLMGITSSKVSTAGDDLAIKIPFYKNERDLINNSLDCEYVSIPGRLLDTNFRYFALLSTDTCLRGAGVNEGDLMIFNKSVKIRNNEIGCFIQNNKILCRKYYKDDKCFYLKSLDDISDEITCNHINCIGVLIASMCFKY